MRHRRIAAVCFLWGSTLVGCGSGPSAPAAGIVEVQAVNGTQATVMAGPDFLFFLKPGESTFVVEFSASKTSGSFRAFDFIENTPVPFLEVTVSIPSAPSAGCRANVTVTRDSAVSDGQCGVRVDSVRTLP